MMLFGGFFLTPLFGHFFPFSSLNSWFGGNLIYHLPQSVHVCESFRKGEGEGNRDRKGEQHTHTHIHTYSHITFLCSILVGGAVGFWRLSSSSSGRHCILLSK